jgi:hypothetical protein
VGEKKYPSHTHFNSDRIRVSHTDKKSSPYLYLNCHSLDLEDSLSGGPRRATAIFLSIFPSVGLKVGASYLCLSSFVSCPLFAVVLIFPVWVFLCRLSPAGLGALQQFSYPFFLRLGSKVGAGYPCLGSFVPVQFSLSVSFSRSGFPSPPLI